MDTSKHGVRLKESKAIIALPRVDFHKKKKELYLPIAIELLFRIVIDTKSYRNYPTDANALNNFQ